MTDEGRSKVSLMVRLRGPGVREGRNHGIEAIELHLRTARHERRAIYDAYVQRRVVERMRGPVRNLRAVEGRLLVVDFRRWGSDAESILRQERRLTASSTSASPRACTITSARSSE